MEPYWLLRDQGIFSLIKFTLVSKNVVTLNFHPLIRTCTSSLSLTHSFYLAGSNVKEGEKRKITFPLYLFLSYIILSKLKTRVLFLMREREENIRVREREI